MLLSTRVHRSTWFARLFALLVSVACAGLGAEAACATTFSVNSTADVHDATPGDGVCETASGNHICTLRAAVEEANAHVGPDTIVLQAGVTYLLTLASTIGSLTADLVIDDDVTISGAGANSTIIDGNGAATGQRVFVLLRCIGNDVDPQTQSCVQGEVTVSVSGITIEHGFSTNIAGGIDNFATTTLDHVAVTGNTANGTNDWGAGIMNWKNLTLTNSTVSANVTGTHNAYGGGIFSQGSLTITNSTISGNSTAGTLGHGGGIFITGLVGDSTKITQSTISGNSATVGGGIYKAGTPTVLINDTISGNDSAGSGGGIYNAGGTTGLYNVTVTQNRANSDDSGSEVGGGLANASGATLTVINSIVAANNVVIPTMPFPTLDVDECAGTITSQGYNIFEYVNSGHCTVGGPYGTDGPQLGPLQFNGGLTQTHAIAPPSPAVDAGNPSGCTDDLGASVTTDQRGITRPYGPSCDIGAFEYADEIFKNGFN